MWKTALLLTATCNILQLLRLQKTCWFWVLWKCTYSSSNTNSECQFARPEDRDLKFTWSFNDLLFTISILDLLPPLGRGVIWLRRKKRLLCIPRHSKTPESTSCIWHRIFTEWWNQCLGSDLGQQLAVVAVGHGTRSSTRGWPAC